MKDLCEFAIPFLVVKANDYGCSCDWELLRGWGRSEWEEANRLVHVCLWMCIGVKHHVTGQARQVKLLPQYLAVRPLVGHNAPQS